MATPRPLGVGQWTLTRNGCGQRSATIPHWFGAPCRRRSQIPPPCTDSPVEEVRLDSWHRGRVVLIGDAAHATAPVWAQGAAPAAEDALVLAERRTPHLSDRPPLPGRPLETRRSLSVWPCTAPAVGLSRPRPAARPIPSNGTSRGVTSGQLFPRLGGKFGYLKTSAPITHTWLLSDAGFRMAPRWPEQDRLVVCS